MTNTSFTPAFGPNGAELNAPSLTPEMREKLKRAARPPTGKELLREFRMFAAIAIIAMIALNIWPPAYKLLKSSPWWSGAFAGVLASIAFMGIWRAVGRNLRRWELRSDQRTSRYLSMPEWARWSFAVADSMAVSGYATIFAIFLSDIEQKLSHLSIQVGLVAFGAAMLGTTLRFVGKWRGWKLDAEV